VDWIGWALASMLLFGVWGVISRPVIRALDWRVVAPISLLGYIVPVALLFLIEPPSSDGLDALAVLKAVSVGLTGQVALFMFYKALDDGGKASIVVPLTALYPAVTLAGAYLFLDESLGPLPLAGVVLAIVAAVLVSQE
jgi:transporter family protein